MRVFIIRLLGDEQNQKLAFIDGIPDVGLYASCMAKGERIGDHYPDDAKIYLKPKSPGTKLTSLIGNSRGYLIVNEEMKNVILSECMCEIEVLPFVLYDHKKRILTTEYYIVNPIGTVACVNREASDIVYLDSTKAEIVKVKKFVLDPDKAMNAPALFRVPENPRAYFAKENLVKAFQDHQFTNVFLTEVEIRRSEQS